jgi:hypothetical protein
MNMMEYITVAVVKKSSSSFVIKKRYAVTIRNALLSYEGVCRSIVRALLGIKVLQPRIAIPLVKSIFGS